MGAKYSMLDVEKCTWLDHMLKFDEGVRKANMPLINRFVDGQKLHLASTTSSWGGVSFTHWFVTNDQEYFEFGAASTNVYDARVTINTYPRYNYSVHGAETTTTMGSEIRNRMVQIVGLCNYSLCLRNCEHVANFVFNGYWFCGQIERGPLAKKFKKYIMGPDVKKINAFPSNAVSSDNLDTAEKIYSSEIVATPIFVASRIDYFLDYEKDTHNVVVVGPTGSGKSHLINVLFNSPICKSLEGHKSITKDVCFIRGSGAIMTETGCQRRKVVVADTVGLCDTERNDAMILTLLKSRVGANMNHIDAVYVVFEGRLLSQHVQDLQKVLRWLLYSQGDNYKKFVFIVTKAANVSTERRKEIRQEAVVMLNLNQDSTIIYTDFPPECDINDSAKDRVKACIARLAEVQTGLGNRITIEDSNCCPLM